nr:MAG TPA: hypothetical protein [Bacteriophage sp.]
MQDIVITACEGRPISWNIMFMPRVRYSMGVYTIGRNYTASFCV